MLRGMVAGGTAVLPGIGSDIADPDAKETAYEGTPVEPLRSMLRRWRRAAQPASTPSMRMPLLLMNSPQDHVVEPAQAEFLADALRRPASSGSRSSAATTSRHRTTTRT